MVIGLGVLLNACTGGFNRDRAPSDADMAVLAQAACHDAVEKQLKDPRSAEYHGERQQRTSTGWSISGTVYATNSFGATVPTNYSCTVTLEGDTVRARAVLD